MRQNQHSCWNLHPEILFCQEEDKLLVFLGIAYQLSGLSSLSRKDFRGRPFLDIIHKFTAMVTKSPLQMVPCSMLGVRTAQIAALSTTFTSFYVRTVIVIII